MASDNDVPASEPLPDGAEGEATRLEASSAGAAPRSTGVKRATTSTRRSTAKRARAEAPTPAASPMRRTIVHVTAEYSPFARTGGLGEAVAGLARYQARAGHKVVVFMPLYASARAAARDLVPLTPPEHIVVGQRVEELRFFGQLTPSVAGGAAGPAPQIVFIDAPGYYDRPGLYGDSGSDYGDNDRRFALLCLGALHGASQLAGAHVLFHVHDWHAALVPVYLHTDPRFAERLGPTPTVLSVHNAGYQGLFRREAIPDLGLPPDVWRLDRMEWYGHLNYLKGGLAFCDMAVTVSPSHAAELRTAEGGFGLHDDFIALGDRLVGIANGIDQERWDPATDPHIPANYMRGDLHGKAACKEDLQRFLGLQRRADVPVFGMTARVVKQKGFDLILQSERVRHSDAQFIFLGLGDPGYEAALTALAREHPGRIAVEFGFTDVLEHRLLAGSDVIMMPSLYEPCGLTQMRAQRFGDPVLARRVGGLRDTVDDGVTGFLFDSFEPAAFDEAIDRATARFRDATAWTTLMRNAMERDFGWERSVERYMSVYDAAVLRTVTGG